MLARGLGSLVTLSAVSTATSVNHRSNPTAAPLAEATLAACVLRSPSPVHLWPQRSALNCPSPQPHTQQLCCPQALCCGPLPWTASCPVLPCPSPPSFRVPSSRKPSQLPEQNQPSGRVFSVDVTQAARWQLGPGWSALPTATDAIACRQCPGSVLLSGFCSLAVLGYSFSCP